MVANTSASEDWSFVVSSKFPCDEMTAGMENFQPDPIWRITALGCKVLLLLQDMYHFQMTYEEGIDLLRADNQSYPDIYAQALALSPYILDDACPMEAIINRRYGFILRCPYQPFNARKFYTLPFSQEAWFSVFLMINGIIIPILYLLCIWEKRVLRAREEYSFVYELMAVFGVCCQHFPPIKPILMSRRIAYFVFFMFAWLMYTYYSSNLLSHLVNDKSSTMTAEELADSDYQFVRLDSLKPDTGLPWYASAYKQSFPKYEETTKKVVEAESMNIADGLTAVGTKKVALLSDYVTIYPYMTTYLNNDAICEIIEVNIFSGIKEYVFTSKTFPLKDHFKIGMLKIKESGLLKRIKQDWVYSAPKCEQVQQIRANFEQMIAPLATLGGACVAAAILLYIERAYYDRNRIWPFVN